MDIRKKGVDMTRHAGLSFMVGMVLVFAGSVLMPGNFLIDMTDPADYSSTVDAWANNAILAQWMTLVTLISLVLMVFGAIGLYPLASSQGGLAGRLLQFGIIAVIIEWSLLIVVQGMRHFAIHLLQREALGHSGLDFAVVALETHVISIAVMMAFFALFPIGTLLLGLGLAGRFGSMDIYKIASYVLVIVGLIGVVNFLIAINSPDVGLDLLLYVNNSVLYLGGISLFIIGLGMYKGRSELTADVA